MSLRRRISCCAAVVAAGLALAACGSGSSEEVSFSGQESEDFQNRLDQISAFIDDQECDRATDAVTGLSVTVASAGNTSEAAKADLQELLDTLEGQIEEDCQDSTESSSTSTTESTSTTTTTTDESSTTDTDTEESTSSEETTTEPPEDEETTPPETTPPETTPPPASPPGGPGGGGGSDSGGVSPGFESDREAAR